MIRRRALMGVSHGRLPSGYQEVEWIESHATEYLNLGIAQNRLLNFDVYVKSEITSGCLFGLSNQGSGYASPIAIYNNLFFSETVMRTLSDVMYASLSRGTNNNSMNVTIQRNGSLVVTKTNVPYAWNTADYKLALFKSTKTWWSELPKAQAKLSYFKIFDRTFGNDIVEMIPCYRKNDGEIGMYDVVNETFLTNQGTGTFTKGADV